jgi:hypothetical protein
MSETKTTSPVTLAGSTSVAAPSPTLIQELETNLRDFAAKIELEFSDVVAWVKNHF